MLPPSNINKPRQFLRPGPPFSEASVQAEPQSPMPESAQKNASWQQPQPENISWQQPPVTGSYSSQVYETDFTAAFSVNPYAQSIDTGAQIAPPAQPSFQDQQSQQGGQFATGNHSASPFPLGGQRASQFQPFGTSNQGVPIYPVTSKQPGMPPFEPNTGRQEAAFYQPQPGMSPFGPNTGRQEAASYQLQPGMPLFRPLPSNSAAFATPPSTIGMAGPASVSLPMTGPQYAPPFPGGLAGQQMNNFQAPSSPLQGTMAMPGFSSFSTGQANVPPMPGFPGTMPNQQSASWSTTNTGMRSAPMPASASTKQASVKQTSISAKPLKQSPAKKKSLPLLISISSLLLLAVFVLVSQRSWLLSLTNKQQTSTQQSANDTPLSPGINTITNNKEISPFVFGANMGLFHTADEAILNSAATRQQMKNIGVRIIRMPYRPDFKPEVEIAAARRIKEIGASALVVMHGPEFDEHKYGPLFDADQQVISDITGVFGNQPVYFEFGNESDLNGVDVDHYVAKWNQLIPSLKKQFPTARFIALDNFQFTRRYLKTFLQKANPLPDGVSWHEYACSVHWSAAFCLANVDTWPIHFAQARVAMMEAIGKELPIWISEWNYTSDQELDAQGNPINDGKYNDPAFMKAWTMKAMQALVDGRVFAAMQYFATDKPMPLIYNDKIALEGQIFQDNYKKIMVDNKLSPPAYYQGPPAPVLNPNAQYSFENGLAGWALSSGNSSQPTISTAKALDGTHSLHITLPNVSEDDTPTIAVNASPTLTPPKPGQMISTYIYVSNSSALMNAKIFVSNAKYEWKFSNSITLTPGTWTKIWYSLPLDYTSQVFQFGIQFFTSHPGVSTDVYVDGFEWK